MIWNILMRSPSGFHNLGTRFSNQRGKVIQCRSTYRQSHSRSVRCCAESEPRRDLMADRWEALVGPAIVVDLQVMRDHAVVVRNEHIEAVVPISQLPSDITIRHFGSGFLAVVPISQLPSDITIRHFGSGFLTAGLVDIHAHGAAGCGFLVLSNGAATKVGT